MTKAQLLKPYESNPDLRLLLSRLLDKYTLMQTKKIPAYTGFLSQEEQEQGEEIGRAHV